MFKLRCSGVFIVNFEHISHLVPVFLLLTLIGLMLRSIKSILRFNMDDIG